jgi:predicted component of type VI protein secretion system
MPFLIVRSGPRSGERIELIDELVVGRENADLTVHDEEVSRRHLAVRPHDDGVELEDLGSTNGTFVDGARLSAVVVVSTGARVTLGETELEIEIEVPELDPGATRVRERPPEHDATIVRPSPVAAAPPSPPPPAATIAGAPAPPTAPPRAAPAPAAAAPPPAAAVDARPFGTFTPAPPARRRTGAATRLWGPATIVFLVIIATAIALIIYFATR